jgi:hypothetical protein
VIAPEANSAFVANMEDVLEVYQRPHDPERPVVCLDETSKQLILETRAAVPAKPGRKARHDYEYERNGVANLFMLFAPLEGWRRVKVTDRHAAVGFLRQAVWARPLWQREGVIISKGNSSRTSGGFGVGLSEQPSPRHTAAG